MQWTPDIAVGVDKIDDQHKELFRRMDKLVEAIKSKTCKVEIGPTLSFLEEYVTEHFSDEEALMREVGYPAYDSHRALHDGFIAEFADLNVELEGESSSYNKSAYTNKMVVDWIVAHIKSEDMKLGAFINKKAG